MDDDLRLDLEAAGRELKLGERLAPKSHEPVAELREPTAEEPVDQPPQAEVSERADPTDVRRSAEPHEPRALDEVVAMLEEPQVTADLGWIHAAIRVEHHDQVPARGGEAGPYGGALPSGALEHDPRIGSRFPHDGDRLVGRTAIDDDELVEAVGQPVENPPDVLRLVQRGNDRADGTAGVVVSRKPRAAGVHLGTPPCQVLHRAPLPAQLRTVMCNLYPTLPIVCGPFPPGTAEMQGSSTS